MSNNKYSAQGATIETGSKFLSPGIQIVKFTKVDLGKSKADQPKVTLTVEDNTGASASHTYSMNMVVGEGKKVSGWDITKNALLQILVAITSNEDKARAIMEAGSDDELITKLSAAMIGKGVRIKLNGEEVMTQAGNKFVKATFGTGAFVESVSTPTDSSKLRFDASKNIKRLPAEIASTPVNSSNTW